MSVLAGATRRDRIGTERRDRIGTERRDRIGTERRDRIGTVALLAGFAAAVALRVLTGAPQPATSATAGLLFAAALTALSVAAGTRVRVDARSLLVGAVGAAVLCLPAAIRVAGADATRPGTAGYASWAAVVTVVAVAEEAFLRGALYDAVRARASVETAVAVAAVCFAALHVPLYGWHVVPLDLAVGLWLGALRVTAGTWTAPAVAHVGADLAGWFLR